VRSPPPSSPVPDTEAWEAMQRRRRRYAFRPPRTGNGPSSPDRHAQQRCSKGRTRGTGAGASAYLIANCGRRSNAGSPFPRQPAAMISRASTAPLGPRGSAG
jgi:hypothetical protein